MGEKNKTSICDQVIGQVWENIRDPEKRKHLNHQDISLFQSWYYISKLLRYVDKDNLSLKEKKDIWKYLRHKAYSEFKNKSDDCAWIHLYGFLSNLWEINPELIHREQYQKEQASLPEDMRNNLLFFLAGIFNEEELLDVVTKIPLENTQSQADVELVLENEQKRHQFWKNVFYQSEENYHLKSHIAVGFHILGTVFKAYRKSNKPTMRSYLSCILIYLTRTFLKCSDTTNIFFERFFEKFSGGNKFPYSEILDFRYEVLFLEKFEHLVKKRKNEIFRAIRKYVEVNKPELIDQISLKINKIVHGDMLHVPKHSKNTNLCQITYFIRQPDPEQEKHDIRIFSNYLAEDENRKSPEIKEKALIRKKGKAGYEWKNEDEEKILLFNKWLDIVYGKGQLLEYFQKLYGFHPSTLPYSSRRTPIVWIADGEITFYFILTVLNKLYTEDGTERNTWYDGDEDLNILITGNDTLLPGQQKVGKDDELINVKNLKSLFTEEIRLFSYCKNKGLKPTDKYWSLYNFLERYHFEENRPYYDKELFKIAHIFYTQIRFGESDDIFKNFLSAFKILDEKINKDSKFKQVKKVLRSRDDIIRKSRLASYLLEIIYRQKEDEARTLFFYSNMIETFEAMGKMFHVPGTFVAGTFMGLESEKWPFIIKFLDAHLWPLLELFNPILYQLLAFQLKKDEEEIKKFSKDKEKAALLPQLSHGIGTELSSLSYSVSSIENIFTQKQKTIELWHAYFNLTYYDINDIKTSLSGKPNSSREYLKELSLSLTKSELTWVEALMKAEDKPPKEEDFINLIEKWNKMSLPQIERLRKFMTRFKTKVFELREKNQAILRLQDSRSDLRFSKKGPFQLENIIYAALITSLTHFFSKTIFLSEQRLKSRKFEDTAYGNAFDDYWTNAQANYFIEEKQLWDEAELFMKMNMNTLRTKKIIETYFMPWFEEYKKLESSIFDFNIKVPTINLDADTVGINVLNIFFQEIFLNSLKYALKENGKVTLNLDVSSKNLNSIDTFTFYNLKRDQKEIGSGKGEEFINIVLDNKLNLMPVQPNSSFSFIKNGFFYIKGGSRNEVLANSSD